MFFEFLYRHTYMVNVIKMLQRICQTHWTLLREHMVSNYRLFFKFNKWKNTKKRKLWFLRIPIYHVLEYTCTISGDSAYTRTGEKNVKCFLSPVHFLEEHGSLQQTRDQGFEKTYPFSRYENAKPCSVHDCGWGLNYSVLYIQTLSLRQKNVTLAAIVYRLPWSSKGRWLCF